MAANRKYIVGQYEEYYNSLRGEGNASTKASSFISDVSNLVSEFSNISNIMTYWSGEAKDAMTNDAIESILNEFSITQKNMQETLGPACEAIDYLSQALENMKSREDELLQAENELESLIKNEPSLEKNNPNYDKNDPNSKKTIHNDEHDTWQKNVDEKKELITTITDELDKMKEDIDKAIKTIEDLESSLTKFTNYMNLTGSVLGIEGSNQFSGYTLEERLKYIQNIIDNYQTIYDSLNEVYEKQYGKGFSFSATDFENLDVIFQAFDIYWMSGMDNGSLKKGGNSENALLDIEKLNKIVAYCNNSGIFEHIEKYLDGASWKDSGLQDFYWENSPNFLKIGVFGENDLKNRLKQNYGVDEANVRSFLKEKYESYKGSYSNLMTSYSEYRQLTSTMATIKDKINSLKHGQKLIPFEMEMENDDFVTYLEKDYSGYNYLSQDQRSVMTQKEIALYDYLLHNKSKSEADAYMDAMENAINQRIGAKKATEYVQSLRANGFDGWDLLSAGATGVYDGVRSFGQGFINLFAAASLEEGEKSALDWELMYKQQFIQDLMNDPSYVDQNLDKQWHGWTNLSGWYNTGSSIGNMAIPAVVGMIPGCQGLSSALFAASIAGNTAAEAKYEGYSTAQAYIYGGITGLSEMVTEKLLGGIDNLSTKALGRTVLQNMFSEGTEEFVQEYLDLGVRALVLGEEVDFSQAGMNAQLNKAAESFKYGAITAGVMDVANRGNGFVLNAATKTFSPAVRTETGAKVYDSNGKVVKKYTSYQEMKSTIESKHQVEKAKNVFNETIDKVNSGKELSLADKVKLNNTIGNLSVEELSNMTKEMNSTNPNASQIIQDAAQGVVKLSKNTNAQFEAAELYNQVTDPNVNLKDIRLTKDDFKEELTRDGRTLSDIIADQAAQRADYLTPEARNNIQNISKSELKSIDKSIDKMQKRYEKQMRKELKQQLKNTDARVYEQTDTQSSNSNSVDARVQQEVQNQVEQPTIERPITEQIDSNQQEFNSNENSTTRLNEEAHLNREGTVVAMQSMAQNAVEQVQSIGLQTETSTVEDSNANVSDEIKIDTKAVKEAVGGVSLASAAAISTNSMMGAISRASQNAQQTQTQSKIEGQTRKVGPISTSTMSNGTQTTKNSSIEYNASSRTSTISNQNLEFNSSESNSNTSSSVVQNNTQLSSQLADIALSNVKGINSEIINRMSSNELVNMINQVAENPTLVQDLGNLLKENDNIRKSFSNKLEEVFNEGTNLAQTFSEATESYNYKASVIDTLIKSGLINNIGDNVTAVMVSSGVSSKELLNTKRAIDVFNTYISDASSASYLYNCYCKVDAQVFNEFLQKPEVINSIKNLDSNILLQIASKNSSWSKISTIAQEVYDRYHSGNELFEGLRNQAVLSKFSEMVTSSLNKFDSIFGNGSFNVSSPQILEYTLTTGETLTLDLGDIITGNLLSINGIDKVFDLIENNSVTSMSLKSKYDVAAIENKINELAGKKVCGSYSSIYTTLTAITVDNETITLDLSKFITTNELLGIFDKVSKDQIKSITVEPNTAKNNLMIDKMNGKSFYEINLVVDGKEHTIYSKYDDLNYQFKNAKTAEIKSVREVGTFNQDVSDLSLPVKVGFDADGKHYEKYVFPTVGLFEKSYNIDDYLMNSQITGIQNVQVETITQEQFRNAFKEKYTNYDSKSESSVLFSEKYGGNQSDVPDLLSHLLNKETMTPIEQKKAQLIETISDKYYSNLTDIQKVNLSSFYANSGCFYMAVSNSFASYMSSIPGGEQIFKNNFGFDLFTEVDGKRSLNLEAIAYDLFLSQSIDVSYADFITSSPGANYRFGTILNNYFSSHGISIDYSTTVGESGNLDKRDHSVSALQNECMTNLINNDGKYNFLFASGFDMDQLTFNSSESATVTDAALANATQVGNKKVNVGGHAMMITGIDANGDIIVTSWGRKYKIDLTCYEKVKSEQAYDFASIGFNINQDLQLNHDSVTAVQTDMQTANNMTEYNQSENGVATKLQNESTTLDDETITVTSNGETQTFLKSEIISQIEQEMKDLPLKSAMESIRELSGEEYEGYKKIFVHTLISSDSSVRIDVLTSFIPSAIKNGDIELLNRLRTELSTEDISQVKDKLSSIDTIAARIFDSYGIDGLDKASIETEISEKSVSDIYQEMQRASKDSSEYQRNIEETSVLIETNSKETGKMVSAIAPILIQNNDLNILSDMKSQMSIQERMEVRKQLELISPESAKVFASINSNQDFVDLFNKFGIKVDENGKYVYHYLMKEIDVTDVISWHVENIENMSVKGIERYIDFVKKHSSSFFCNTISLDWADYTDIIPDVSKVKSIDTSFFEDTNYDTFTKFEVIYKHSDGSYVLSYENNNHQSRVPGKVMEKHVELFNSLDESSQNNYLTLFNDSEKSFRLFSGDYEWVSNVSSEEAINLLKNELNKMLSPKAESIVLYNLFNGMGEYINSINSNETIKNNLSLSYNSILNLNIADETKNLIAHFLGTKIDNLTPKMINDTIAIATDVQKSNSLEMKRFTEPILNEVFKTEDPFTAIEKIRNIFEKNNLPIVGKIYKCFEILYPNMNEKLSKISSPMLLESGSLRRKVTIFSDLIKASFGSNNRSVNNYLANLEFGQNIFEQIKNNSLNIDSLTTQELNELITFRNHLATMFESTMVGKYGDFKFSISDNIANDILVLASTLSPNGTLDYNLGDRLVDMFCGFTDIKTLNQAKEYIDTKIQSAEQRNIEASKSKMMLEEGDLVKGLSDKGLYYLEDILQNGSVSKEFLGSDASSDNTPFDTDLSVIEKTNGTTREKIQSTAANGYGPIYLVLKNDSRFVTSRTVKGRTDANIDSSKIELFYTGVLGDGHYGIRTGFASSEINYIVMENFDPRVGLEIAKNGFYIPVADLDGNITFSYEDYTNLRRKISGLSYYGNSKYSISENLLSEKVLETQTRVAESIDTTKANVDGVTKQIKDVLINSGVEKVFDGYTNDLSANSAEIYSTGSTSRGTNVPGDSDFDYLVKIDREIYFDEKSLSQIKEQFKKQLGLTDGPGGKVVGEIKNANGEVLDVEISFCPKTDKVEFSTDVALSEKLNAIKEQSPEHYQEVLANIVTAKEIMKEAHAYKSAKSGTGEGGLGGIGIENWILQHGGSLHDAAVDFLAVADQCTGFNEFKEKYQVFDLGENHYSDKTGAYPHENFVFETKDNENLKMTPEGYERMKAALREYLNNEIIIKPQQNSNIEVESSINNTTSNNTLEIDSNIDADMIVLEDEVILDGAVGDVDKSLSKVKDISHVIDVICKKYNCSQQKAFARLEFAAKTGINLLIPKAENAKAIVKQFSKAELRETIDAMHRIENVPTSDLNKVEYSIKKYMEKYNVSKEKAIEVVKRVVDTENYNFMTSFDNARDTLKDLNLEQLKATIERIEMQDYLKRSRNAGYNSNFGKPQIDQIIMQNVEMYKADHFIQNQFDKTGNSSNSTYGVNQGVLYDLFQFQDKQTGVKYSYRETKSIIEKAVANHQVLPKFRKIAGTEYFEFKNKMANKYNISSNDVSIIMESIDDLGACSYASVCNEIFTSFLGKEIEFENRFGFSMYTTINGETVFNAKELLFDVYFNSNTIDNGGAFIEKTSDGYRLNLNALNAKVDPLGRRMLNTDQQLYLSSTKGKNIQLINNYLKNKGLGFSSTVIKNYKSSINSQQMANVINRVINGINSGRVYSLGVYSYGSPINFYSLDINSHKSVSTSNWHEGAGHSIFITGVNEEGFIVSSWGQKYLISYTDLVNGGKWILTEDYIGVDVKQNYNGLNQNYFRRGAAFENSVYNASSTQTSQNQSQILQTYNLRTNEGHPIKLQTINQYMDSKTGKTMNLYSVQISTSNGIITKVFSAANNINMASRINNIKESEISRYFEILDIKNFNNIEVKRPNGDLLVVEDGTRVVAGVKLNKYLIVNQKTGQKYNVCTETDIINNTNGNTQRAGWLSDSRLSLKTKSYEGYIGELRPTGEIIKSGKIIDAIERGYIKNIKNRVDIEAAMRNRPLLNAGGISYNSVQSAVTYTVEGSKVDMDLIEAVNNYVRNSNQYTVLDIKKFEDLNPNILNSLDSRVIIHNDEFFGNGFYGNIDLNEISIKQKLDSYYSVDSFINNYNNLLQIRNNMESFISFYNTFKVSEASKTMAKYATAFFYNQVANGRIDAIKIMNALTQIKQKDQFFNIVIDNEGGGYYSSRRNIIHFSLDEMSGNHYTTFFHEVGHCLFDKVFGEKMPSNIEQLFDNAQRHMTNSPQLSQRLKDTLQKLKDRYEIQAKAQLEENLRKQGYHSIDEYLSKIKQNLISNPEMVRELKDNLIEQFSYDKNMKEEYANRINSYSVDDLVNFYKILEIDKLKDNLCRTDDAYSLVSGMIDHLFFGNHVDLNGNSLPHGYGHSYKYFHDDGKISNSNNRGTFSGDYKRAFHEMVADYVSYQFSPNKQSIKAINAILGQDLVNELNKIYNTFVTYGLNANINPGGPSGTTTNNTEVNTSSDFNSYQSTGSLGTTTYSSNVVQS